MVVLSEDFRTIALLAASRLEVDLKEPTITQVVDSELAKLKIGEPVSVFEAGRVEKFNLGVATASLLLQAISIGIQWQEYSNSQVPPNSVPSCQQVVNIIQQNITIDEFMAPDRQNLIIHIAAEEIVNQINSNTPPTMP